MSNTATVKIFLTKGKPTSVRTAEISNWTGKAVAGPRYELEDILKREEATRAGVYFLIGVDPATGQDKVYIGQTENIKTRIKQHLDKDFWKNLVFFVSKDENLTGAHIRYLEGKIITMARGAGRFKVENTQEGGARLPEADAADMDTFLAHMEQLLPILGQEFLKPSIQNRLGQDNGDLLSYQTRNAQAKARQTDSGFVVLKGSTAALEETASAPRHYPYIVRLRKDLKEMKVIKEEGNKLLFVKDHEFASSSAAAGVISGGSVNGLEMWRYSNGDTLKARETKRLDTQQDESTLSAEANKA